MITQAELKKLIHYDPETGALTWLVNRGTRARAGKRAGCTDGQGYCAIRINNKRYDAHRLAWLYMTGIFPAGGIDHKNMVRIDNRFCNLRLSNKSTNAMNRPAQANSVTGIKGVCWARSNKKWCASIAVRGFTRRDHFNTIEEAAAAYEMWAKVFHGDFSRIN